MTQSMKSPAVAASLLALTLALQVFTPPPAGAAPAEKLDHAVLKARADSAAATGNAFGWIGWISTIGGGLTVVGGAILIANGSTGANLTSGIFTVATGTLSIFSGVAALSASGRSWEEEKLLRIKLSAGEATRAPIAVMPPPARRRIHQLVPATLALATGG